MHPKETTYIDNDLSSWKDVHKRSHHTSTLFGHYVITIGGKDNMKVINDITVLDLQKNELYSVVPTGSKLIQRYNHSACLFQDNKIIVFGGIGPNSQRLNSTVMITIKERQRLTFDCKILEAEDGKELYRDGHTANIFDDKMFIFGGTDSSNTPSNDLWCLDLKTYTWTLCHVWGDVPDKCCEHGSVVYGSMLYVFGGYSFTPGICLNRLYCLDLSEFSSNSSTLKSLKWSQIYPPEQPLAPRYGNCLHHHQGKLYFLGGSTNVENFNEIDIFDIEKSSWQQALLHTDIITPKVYFSVVPMENGLIIWSGYELLKKHVNTIFRIKWPISCGNREQDMLKERIIGTPIKFNSSPCLYKVRRLFLREIKSDIKIKVEDRVFPAHKSVLAERSRYFKNMFSSNMQESKSAVLEIPGVKEKTFRTLLEIMYCNTATFTEELALDLLELSDKWCMLEVRGQCEQFLINSLSINNVVFLAGVAERYENQKLINAIVSLIKTNLSTFLKYSGGINQLSSDLLELLVISSPMALVQWRKEFVKLILNVTID